MLLAPILCLLSAAPEDLEPALKLYFEAEGGKRVAVELDKPFDTAALGKRATLKVEPTRHFAYAGVEFDYPREYTFEASLDSPAFSQWTLSGNDCKVMVQRHRGKKNAESHLKAVVEAIRKAYASKSTEAPVKLELGARTLNGTRLDVDLASTRMVQELYAVRSGPDVIIFIVQDSPLDSGQPSKDRQRTEALIRASLKLP
jgi:hypothetical protein